MTTRAAPKPTPRIKEPKRLASKPHRIPEPIRNETFEMWGRICMWCWIPGGALDLHHVLRRSQGGKDDAWNLRPLHRLCHGQVHRDPAVARRLGLLAGTGSND